jgi:hypothetical protein
VKGKGTFLNFAAPPDPRLLPYRFLFFFLFLSLLLPSCSHKALQGGRKGRGTKVAVRVTFREAPVPGARVEAYLDFGEEGERAVAAGVTGDDGTATLFLPAGRYSLVSEWRKDGEHDRPIEPGDRFSYFGGNPVYIAEGSEQRLFLGLEEFREPPRTVEGEGQGTGVSGYVREGDEPVAAAHVYAYLRPGSGFRAMGFAASAPTTEDGTFLLDLPPGRYFLVARKRAGGGIAGPLRKGDHFGFYPANPVTVAAGRFTRVVIPATRLKLRNVPAYSGEYKAAAFIEGRILDRKGNPVSGVYAALYDNPDLLNRPVFLSDVTGKDGRYRLPVPVPGDYYLGARSGYGGAPAPGDLYGRYEGNPEHSVTVRAGDRLTGADIVVFEVW